MNSLEITINTEISHAVIHNIHIIIQMHNWRYAILDVYNSVTERNYVPARGL